MCYGISQRRERDKRKQVLFNAADKEKWRLCLLFIDLQQKHWALLQLHTSDLKGKLERQFVSLSPPQAAVGSLNTFGIFQDLRSKHWTLQNVTVTLRDRITEKAKGSVHKNWVMQVLGSLECFSASVCFHQHYQFMCTACCWNVRVFMPDCLQNAPYGAVHPCKQHIVGRCSCR